jgi:4-amino-4-deoxy-L-arabinose transferase-like glycosyltransferase
MNLPMSPPFLPHGKIAPASLSPAVPPWALLVVTLLALAWFGPIEHRDLFHPDEGRYAEIAREMVASGDWVSHASTA